MVGEECEIVYYIVCICLVQCVHCLAVCVYLILSCVHSYGDEFRWSGCAFYSVKVFGTVVRVWFVVHVHLFGLLCAS